ncbi:MAG: sporulation integral membrane protein YtvI [Oscillospiraceae bacterium]|nr:sporulation integral membrane protein YtvI [Oscillospiraceae bacterium]
MTPQKKVNFMIDSLFAAWVIFLIWLTARYLLSWTLPFFLGLCISIALHPVVIWVSSHSCAQRKYWSVMLLFLLYLMLGAFLWWLGAQLILGLQRFLPAFSDYCMHVLAPSADAMGEKLLNLLSRYSPASRGRYEELLAAAAAKLRESASAFSGGLIEWAGNFAARLPLYVTTFLFTILSSFFISRDYTRVVSFLMRQLPQKARRILFDVRHFLVGTLFRVCRAYLLIMVITFLELAAGFFLLRIPRPVFLAAVIAAADLLPLIGTGAVLIPWGAMELLSDSPTLGSGILILYAVITVVRNIIEPKIVGEQIGLHPLATLTAMYLGMRTMGFGGLILMPVIFLLLQYLHQKQWLHLWRGAPPSGSEP